MRSDVCGAYQYTVGVSSASASMYSTSAVAWLQAVAAPGPSHSRTPCVMLSPTSLVVSGAAPCLARNAATSLSEYVWPRPPYTAWPAVLSSLPTMGPIEYVVLSEKGSILE